jgi:hypothetical protein
MAHTPNDLQKKIKKNHQRLIKSNDLVIGRKKIKKSREIVPLDKQNKVFKILVVHEDQTKIYLIPEL